MASTYEPIATTTLGSNSNTVTFSSISSSYTDLILIANFVSTGAGYSAQIRLNGDSGTNYSYTNLTGGSSTIAWRQTSNNVITCAYNGAGTVSSASWIINFMNYSSTTTYKSILSRFGSGDYYETTASVGLWRSTAAISTILLTPDAPNRTNFQTGSIFTLYGVKAA